MTKTMTLRLNEQTHDRFSKLARVTERSKSYLATQALKLFPENNEWQVDEIKQAITAADPVGPDQFVDNDTVMARMESWGTDQESQPPL